MPKAIISNRIYLDTNPEIAQNLVKNLTYRIKKPPRPGLTHFSQFEIIKNYKMLPKGIMSIPSGRQDLIPEHYEIVDKRILHELPFPTPMLQLRESQLLVYNSVDDMCFINAMVGWGRRFAPLLGN
jgi:hypothetical protein